MGAQRSTFGKLERDRAKKAKAAAKRERRLERKTDAGTPDEVVPGTGDDGPDGISAADLLAEIERTHQLFDAGQIGYDEFEEKKAELFARLPID